MRIKINLSKLKSYIIKLLIICTFFDAYYVVEISTFPVTLFTLVSIVLLVFSILDMINWKNIVIIEWKHITIIIFMIYIIINFIYYKMMNVSAFMLIIYFIVLYLNSFRVIDQKEFRDYIKIFQKGMNLLAIYGIYQFIGRIIGLPFTDLIITNHMVEGYNWSNTVNFMGMAIYRANAIFREPSFFAQYLAINILFYIVAFLSDEKKDLKWFGINCIALFMALSGTGILIIAFAGLIYALSVIKNRKTLKRIIGWGSIFTVGIIVLALFTPLGKYLISRSTELFTYNKDASAGFVRFRAWTDLLKLNWKNHKLLGIGIGQSKYLVQSMMNKYFGLTLNGFSKIVIELGVIGIILWCIFIALNFYNKECKKNMYLRMMVIIIIPYMFCHETFTSNSYWIFLMILNCKIQRGGEISKIKEYKSYNKEKLLKMRRKALNEN